MEFKSEETSRLLTELTGLTSFSQLQFLELQVNTFEVSLHAFGPCCPAVSQLKLNGSVLDSLRDLGTGWPNLQILWVVNTSLTGLEGLTSFPELRELYAAFNKLNDLSALIFHETIEIADLEANEISDMDQVEYLAGCENLWSLNLESNPICKEDNYREIVLRTVPSLKSLDDIDRSDAPQAIENNDEVGLVCESVRDSHTHIKNQGELIFRPKSAASKSHLTESNFFGNPLKAMRFNRKKKIMDEAGVLQLIRDCKVDHSKLPSKHSNILMRNRKNMTRKIIVDPSKKK